MKGSNLCEDLATNLFKEFAADETELSGNGRNEGAVLIIDRRLDLVTPILNQVHFLDIISSISRSGSFNLSFQKQDIFINFKCISQYQNSNVI